MPVLMVSENTSPQLGFSRKRSILPSSPVITTPNSSGFCTRFSATVATAPLLRWKSIRAERSMSVSASPETTRKASSR